METLTLSSENYGGKQFNVYFRQLSNFQSKVRNQQKVRTTSLETVDKEQNNMTESVEEVTEPNKTNTKQSESEIENTTLTDKNVNKNTSDGTAVDEKIKVKRKKKWRKIAPSELGFNISLFPRPVRNNTDIEEECTVFLHNIEKELDKIEDITQLYEHLIELQGNTQGDLKYIRPDRDRKVMKAHKQVKTKHCRSVLNNKGRKSIYVNHRVYKLMQLDIHRLCYMPSPKRVKNLEKRELIKGKSNYLINPTTNKPHLPKISHTRAPVQCLAHAIHKDNLPNDLDSALANLLVTMQHRDLTPEDYDLLLRLDERVAPKTIPDNKLKEFKTHTIESNDELEVCPICMELYEKGQTRKYLPCNHAFHNFCIDAWLKNSSMNCPVDNLPVDS